MTPRTRTRLRYVVALGVCALVAAAALALAQSADEPTATPTAGLADEGKDDLSPWCQTLVERARERARVVTGQGRRVVVIGDSWAVGRLVPPRQTWPVFLDGEVHVDGFPGSAISQTDVNGCGRFSFADRAPRAVRGGADLVVIEGGINDVGRSDTAIRAGFGRLENALHGLPVVMLAPPPAPIRDPDRVAEVDALLQTLALQAGWSYVDTADIEITYLDDGLHPDRHGHRIFGTAVAQRVRALGL